MRTIYLVNVSLGLAGTEKRFANIWQSLRRRGRVRPVLVIPEVLHSKLASAGLVPADGEADIWGVREGGLLRAGARKYPDLIKKMPRSEGVRTRLVALRFREMWSRIRADPQAVMHFGLPCNLLPPPKMPVVYECMDSTFASFGDLHYRRAAARPCIVNCQSHRIQIALERSAKNLAPKWRTVVSPCYFAHYADRPEMAADDREFSTVVFMGRFSEEKSPMLFVEAIALLRDRGVNIKGIMLGEGPMLAEIKDGIQRYRLEANLSLDFLKDPQACLYRAGAFVSLQTGDNYGSQALLEAMAAGCPIIATDVGETWRIVDEDVGIRIPPDPGALADAVKSLVSRPDRVASLGAAAAKRARMDYSSDAYASFLESIYEEAYLRFENDR